MNSLVTFSVTAVFVAACCVDCSSACRRRSPTVYIPPPNNNPTIYCPGIGNVYASSGRVTAFVYWSQATAYDQEDRYNVQIFQTQGQLSGTEHSEGSHTVSYMVRDSGLATATCSVSFNVIVVRCSLSGTSLRYGTASCTPPWAKNIYGSACTYTCNPGYMLIGNPRANCWSDGAWSDYPVCLGITCGRPATIVRGKLVCETTAYTYQSRCFVSCDAGYVIERNNIISCQADGTWTISGQCLDKEPPKVSCSNNIEVFAGPKRTPIQVQWPEPQAKDNSGLNVTLVSDHASGSIFDIGQTKVTVTATDVTLNTASCSFLVIVKEKQCTHLQSPDNSDITCSHGNTYGSECTVTCHQAYQLVGQETRVCQNNQTWSGGNQFCAPRNCTAPPTISHGRYECPNGTTYQRSCFHKCENGYRPEAPLTITCDINIQWPKNVGSCLDIQPPSFPDGCPEDMYVNAAPLGEPTFLRYQLPKVTDNSGEKIIAQGDPPSGFSIDVGATIVTVRASDSRGNNESCQFVVYVKTSSCNEPKVDSTDKNLINYNCSDGHVLGASCQLSCKDGSPLFGASTIRCMKNVWTWAGTVTPYCNATACEKLKVPKNGALSCDAPGGGPEICIISCNDKYTYPSTAEDLYTCFSSTGEWKPSNFIPDCVGRRDPNSVTLKPVFYYFTSNCSRNNTEIRQKFLQAINNSQFKALCTNGFVCQVNSVTVTCGPISGGGRKKRDTDQFEYEYKISVEIGISPYKAVGTPVETLAYFTTLGDNINACLLNESDSGLFTISETGGLSNYYSADSNFNCQPGTKIIQRTMSCAGCGEGFMYENETNSCIPCPRATYQNQEISLNCTPCPNGTTTKDIHSRSVQQCLDLCHPGKFSATGITPCGLCPVGSYQSKFGETRCDACPYGMSTLETGGKSNADCLFFDIRLNQESLGPIIQHFDTNSRALSITMWIHDISSLPRTTLSFSLGFSQMHTGAALISIDLVSLLILPVMDNTSKIIRKNFHVCIVYLAGNVNLFVDGIMKDAVSGVSVTDLPGTRITFTSSQDVKYIVSHMQMTDIAFSPEKVREFTSSCDKRVAKNILVVDEFDITLITPSNCSAINSCLGDPCGNNSTCIDGFGKFSCICEELWSGETCQSAPDFCLEHKCGNGARCVNQLEYRNYTCACAKGYTGILCERIIADGNWGLWSPWSVCSMTCGSGQRSRSRECDNPKPDPQGQDCVGSRNETETCKLDPCPVDCRWSQWSAWICSTTCGFGQAIQTRQREQEAQYGGVPCNGLPKITKECEKVRECPVDGNVGEWAVWSSCSATCGGGVSTRRRYCDNPPPSNGGKDCNSSQLSETRTCSNITCPECMIPAVRNGTIWNCTAYNNSEITICEIGCPEGKSIIPAQTNIFQCGIITNYTWTHQTDDNPKGLLPTCSDMKLPSAVLPVVVISYDVDCNSLLPAESIKTSVLSKLAETECQKTGKCDFAIKTGTNCNSRKRSTGALTIDIKMIVKDSAENNNDKMENMSDEKTAEQIQPAQTWMICQNGSIYDGLCDPLEVKAFVTATDKNPDYEGSMTDEIQKLNDTETMIQEFLQMSSQVYNMTVGGVTYTGQIESARLFMACQKGSGFYDGFCVDCPTGTYSPGNGICLHCDQGYYQDEIRSSSCKKCPQGMSTFGKGSYSPFHCMSLSEVHGNMPKPTESTDSESSTNIPAIVGAVAGGACLLLIVGAIIAYCMQKSRKVEDIQLDDLK